MTRFDAHLTDPDADAVSDALTRAVAAVNAGSGRSITLTKVFLRRVAENTAAETEGVMVLGAPTNFDIFNTAPQVLVAWWTSTFGRRHVRVTGRLVHHTQPYLMSQQVLNTRPPVWHIFPESIYRRRVGGLNELVAVCGCGACGSERALGWAGPCCGPCFDYAEEHGAPPASRPALFPTPSPCLSVAASADGRFVAGATADRILVWDADAGTRPVWESITSARYERPPCLALSPTGSHLAAVAFDALQVHDLTAKASHDHRSPVPAVEQVAFHPGGRRVGYTTAGRLMLSGVSELREPVEAVASLTASNPVAFSPDGSRVAVRVEEWGEIHSVDAGGPPVRFPLPESMAFQHTRPPAPQQPAYFAFSGDGSQIAVGVGTAVAVYHAATGERRLWQGSHPAQVSGVAFDPAGRFVFLATADGSLLAYRADSFDPGQTVTLRWGLGPIRGIAAAGDTIYTAVDDGVKAWPVRRLLEDL
jgi:hypothetical protein